MLVAFLIERNMIVLILLSMNETELRLVHNEKKVVSTIIFHLEEPQIEFSEYRKNGQV